MLGLPEWMVQAAEAVPTSVIDDLVADARRSWFIQAKPGPKPARGNGFVEPSPLKPPPGVEWCDRLMDVQDRADLADRLREEMERRRTLAALKPADAPRETSSEQPEGDKS
jgi:hypothetical protein